jgi:hypothetical protein
VQPLQERVHYGFEYIWTKDPTRMSRDKLSEEEILERLQKILKDVSVIPLQFEERDVDHQPATVNVILYICTCSILDLHAV